MDIVDKYTRSRIMASVQQKHTSPEITVRRLLHSAGMRFRLHATRLPGTPDLVLARYRVAVFVQGCFWHYHQDCKYAKIPASNHDVWRLKLEKNVERDHRNVASLQAAGWRVLWVWTCALHGDEDGVRDEMVRWIKQRQGLETFCEIARVKRSDFNPAVDEPI